MSHFPYRKAFILGFGFFGITAIWALFNTFVPLLLAGLGLSATWIGFIMTWDNYLNMFVQPAVGEWSDQTRTRIGRRKPWLLAGAPLAATCFVIIPACCSPLGIMLVILLTNIGMALFRSPTIALMGDLFPAMQRSIANGIISLMGGVGAIVALVGGGILYKFGHIKPFIFGSLVMLAAISLVLLWVREPEIPSSTEKKDKSPGLMTNLRRLFDGGNRPTLMALLTILCFSLGTEAVQTWLSSFANFSLGIEPGRISSLLGYGFVLPSLLFAVPSGLIGTRFGRRRTMLTGLLAMALLLASGWFIQGEAMLIGILVLAGISSALMMVNALPLVYDVGGVRIGALTGLYYFAINAAAVIGPQIVGILIDLTGKNYRVMFPPSALFVALAGFLLTRVKNISNIPSPKTDKPSK